MKKFEIKSALDALKKIKMPKIEDKDLRNVLIENHYVLYDAGMKYDAAIEREKDVLLGAYKEEQQVIEDLQRKLQMSESGSDEQRDIIRELNSHEDYYKAVAKLNEKIIALGKENIDGLKKVDREKFMQELEKQEYDFNIVEGLYPLFVLE